MVEIFPFPRIPNFLSKNCSTNGEYVPTYMYHIRKRQCFALLPVRSIYTGMLVLHHNFGRLNATNIDY